MHSDQSIIIPSEGKMPALVTCRGNKVLEKRWNVGSDDFVLPSFLAMVNGVFVIALIVAVLLTFFLVPGCQHIDIPLIVYCSFSILLVVEFATAIDEAVIFSKSSRGTILLEPSPRKAVGRYIHIRIVLAIAEGFNILACTLAISIPSVKHTLEPCPGFKIALSFAAAVVVILWVLFAGFLIKSLLYTDPLGIFTPGLLQHLTFLDRSDDEGESQEERRDSLTVPLPEPRDFRLGDPRRPRERDESGGSPSEFSVRYWHRPRWLHLRSRDASDPAPIDIQSFQKQHSKVHRAHIGQRRIQRRLRALFCCLGIGGHRSRGIALEDVARGLYTMFDFEDIDLVLSDVIAGLVLVSQDQARRKKKKQSLVKKFRDMTFSVMPTNQKPAGSIDHHPPKPFDFSSVEERLLFDDLLHYMKYAVGVYGWPLHVFTYPCCGVCELCCVTCCVCNYRCCNRRGFTDFLEEDCCMCGIGAMKLETGIKEEDIFFVSYENQIYRAPFSVCVDHNMHAVVVSVRGTLSIKDTLTDMSFSPKYIPVSGRNETYVHGGMYLAAFEICKTLKEKNSEGKGILEKAFVNHEGYQLVITGHSLGAGVASVLALLLRPDYPRLVCYAYSPPGCICSFPLVEYTKKFITSVVLGNDMVPRLSFRSLLYLKYSLRHVLEKCTIPKYQVLFRPRWFDKLPFCRSDTCMDDTTGPELEEDIASQVVNENTTLRGLENALFSSNGPPRKLASQFSTSEELSHSQQPLKYLSKQQSTKQQPPRLSGSTRQESVTPVAMEGILEHCRAQDRDQFMPAFPPGKLLHIEVEKNAKPCCLGCFYPNEMKVSEVCNEDLCVITVDRGTIEDHLPNNVLNALKRCKQQFMDSVYNPGEVERMRRRKSQDRHKEEVARRKTDQKTGFVFPDLRNSLTASVTTTDAGIPQISVTMEGEVGEQNGGRVMEGKGGSDTEALVTTLVGRGGTRLEAGERKTGASPLATIPEERSRSPSPTSPPTVVVQAEVCPDAGAKNIANYHSDLEMRDTQEYTTDISIKNQEKSQQGVAVDNSHSVQPLTIPPCEISATPGPAIQRRANEVEGGGGGGVEEGRGEGKGGKHKKRPKLRLKLERHVAVDLEEVVKGEGEGHDNVTKEEELHGSKIKLHVAEQIHSETTL